VHLRRALLLFAIVLGVAALVASLTRPGQTPERGPDAETTRPAAPRITPGQPRLRPVTLSFAAGQRPQERRVAAGRSATILVHVKAAGQAELDGLGLSAPATPGTPARFELLPDEPGVHPVVFVPAATGVRTRAGTLIIKRSARRARAQRDG
jgi:hypothetical protein